jgi:hypothetical protein
MLKAELMRKLETAIDDAINQSMYGNIEIEFRSGEPVILRYEKTEKLDNRENTRHGYTKR